MIKNGRCREHVQCSSSAAIIIIERFGILGEKICRVTAYVVMYIHRGGEDYYCLVVFLNGRSVIKTPLPPAYSLLYYYYSIMHVV